MNTPALLTGLLYGAVTAVTCYFISLITAGLFGRSFYKTYARILIIICSVMLTAPGLAWMAKQNESFAIFGLSLAHYAVMLVLGYGIVHFNREHLKATLLDRQSHAYFTFGTLAYATIITLLFLHLTLVSKSNLSESLPLPIQPNHYGPLLVMLAALVLHTDYNLKQAVGNLRRFSYFTFTGYALSFVGIALAIMPYLGQSLSLLGLENIETPNFLNFFSAQALLLAIFVYAWLVYRYESIPPLFLLLLAIIGEYHILVTQWAILSYGPACWGISSLPLAVILAYLDDYFSAWDTRKRKASGLDESAQSLNSNPLRFATPFRLVAVGFAIALLSIALWTRFTIANNSTGLWLISGFALYALFLMILSIRRKSPAILYPSILLAALIVPLGIQPFDLTISLSSLGIYAALLSGLALLSEVFGLKREWRTPFADCGLLFAMTALLAIFANQFGGFVFSTPPRDDFPNLITTVSSSLSFAISAYLYRSSLPVYAALAALSAIHPLLCSPIALMTSCLAWYLKRIKTKEPSIALDYRLKLFDSFELPFPATLPSLYYRPLFQGALTLGIIGLFIAISYISQDNLSPLVLLGTTTIAASLAMDTLHFRRTWIYLLAIAVTFLSLHAFAHSLLNTRLSQQDYWSAQLLINSLGSLIGMTIVTLYATWCDTLILRVADAKESLLRANRQLFVEPMRHFTLLLSILALAPSFWLTFTFAETSLNLFLATSVIALIFLLSTWLIASESITYFCLTALTLAIYHLFFRLLHWESNTTTFIALIGLAASALSWAAWQTLQSADQAKRHSKASGWMRWILPKFSIQLWRRPLAVYAILCGAMTIALTTLQWSDFFEHNADLPSNPWALLLAGVSLFLCTRTFRNPLIYLVAIALVFATAHLTLLATHPDDAFALDNCILHLTLTATLGLTACIAAASTALLTNVLRRNNHQDLPPSSIWNREFHSGLLLHFGFLTSLVSLVALLALAFVDQSLSNRMIYLKLVTSVSVALAFVLSSIIYRNPQLLYGSLASIGLGCHAAVFLLEQQEHHADLHAFAIAGFALILGICSRLSSLTLPKQGSSESHFFKQIAIWHSPTTSQVNLTSTLWIIPIVRSAIILALLSIGIHAAHISGVLSPSSNALLTNFPFFLAATAMYFATTSYFSKNTPAEQEQTPAYTLLSNVSSIETWLSYIAFLVTLFLAVHFSFQIHYLSNNTLTVAASWHAALAASIALGGWIFATSYNIRWKQRKACNAKTTSNTNAFYGDALYHLVLAIACLTLTATIYLSMISEYLPVPFTISLTLLALFFGLTAFTYRSRLISYIALLCLGLSGLAISWLLQAVPPTINSGSVLVATIVATSLAILDLAFSEGSRFAHFARQATSRFPSPWSLAADMPGKTPQESSYFSPMMNMSVVYSVFAVVAIIMLSLEMRYQPTVTIKSIVFVSLTATFLIASRQYGAALFTYFASAVVALSFHPFWNSPQPPIATLIDRWIIISIVLSLAALFAARLSKLRRPDDSAGNTKGSIETLYTQPLLYCSSAFAVISMSLTVMTMLKMDPIISVYHHGQILALGAATLLYNAHLLSTIRNTSLAKLVVYMASWLLAVGSLVICYTALGIDYLAFCMASAAFIKAIIGLGIIEVSKSSLNLSPTISKKSEIFGLPFSITALGLALSATVLVTYSILFECLAFAEPDSISSILTAKGLSMLLPNASTLLVITSTSFIFLRLFNKKLFLYSVIVSGFFGSFGLLAYFTDSSNSTLVTLAMLLANALLILAYIYQSRRESICSMFRLTGSETDNPFSNFALVAAATSMTMHTALLTFSFTNAVSAPSSLASLMVIPLSLLFFLQLLYIRPSRWHADLLVVTSIYGCLAFNNFSHASAPLDICIAILAIFWGGLAAILTTKTGETLLRSIRLPSDSVLREKGEAFLRHWARRILMTSVIVCLFKSQFAEQYPPTSTWMLLLVTLAAIFYAFRWRSIPAFTIAVSLLPLFFLSSLYDYAGISALIANASLILASIATTYLVLVEIASRYRPLPTDLSFFQGTIRILLTVSQLVCLSSIIIAMYHFVQSDMSWIVLLSFWLVSICGLWIGLISNRELFVYPSIAGLLVSMLLTLQHFAGTPATSNPIASLSVLLFCLGLYAANLLANRSALSRAHTLVRPTYYLTLVLPSILLITIPWNHSPYAALLLLAAAAFYILISRHSHNLLANYVAAILVNMAIYIWLPVASELTGLYQLYVIPAAVTVLIFAQLHRQDLNPKVLSGIRMATSGAILAVSSYELLLARDPSLFNFLIALTLSLLGVGFGIALRVKPFVYVGLAFLILNVSGQIVMQFQREGGVTRAIILISVGLIVIAAMIFFNIHRERILKNYRTFQMKWE